ncbi:MAG: PadR family transcriptional regulator [Parasphingorhabdus sp.]|uniref:PadR family transcriptional regulator n=1 Tax=Parasphingorhabdus sp. TaxID=2709688 RepID=UPI0032995195
MALRYAILVSLSEGAKSGYDVAKQFDESIGFFWRARHSQIYREMGKLKDSGLAIAEEVQQSGKPNRIVFTITDAGREALLQWSREPSEPPEMKDHFLVQLYGIESVDLDGVRQNLLRRIERHQDRHAEYVIKHELLEDSNSLADLGKQLALEVGMRWEWEWVDWCTKALERLAPEAIEGMTNVVPFKQREKKHAE